MRQSTRVLVFLSLLAPGVAACDSAETAQPTGPASAVPHQYFTLLHAAAVHDELNLTAAQRADLLKLTDRLDAAYFRVRSLPGDEGQRALSTLVAEAQRGAAGILTPSQQTRLNQLACRVEGTSALLRDDVVRQLRLAPDQVEKVRGIVTATRKSLAEIQEKAASAGDGADLQKQAGKLRQDEMKLVWAALNPQQQQGWMRLVGAEFDLSQVTSGPFKAPEFQPAAAWINSEGEKLADLRGRVVVVHFYCFGCINCIHNFPSYRNWLKQFQDRDVTIVGIHTPETPRERDLATVRERAAAEQLDFPILVDTDKNNWNAWGNTMWPTVYLIDKRGYLRSWWQGELNWQGATGEEQMRQKIEALLAE